MKYFRINSRFTEGVRLPAFDEKTVKDEPMFFSSSVEFAIKNGGPITKAFFEAVCRQGVAAANIIEGRTDGLCFDSRVHMLMPGWWPCIPGWHHDDVPRSRSDGQPNYDTPEFHSKHILALVNGDICPTEFAVGTVDMPEVPLFSKSPIYSIWNDIVDKDIEEGSLKKVAVPSNRLIHFDCDSFHRGTRAVKRGWRWFGRLTWDAGYETGRPRHNEIRRQVNVYMDNPTEGW